MTAPGKPGFGTYDPDLLIDLRSNPKVLASRERRSFTLSDRERVEAIQSYFNTAVGLYRLAAVQIHDFHSIKSLTFDPDQLTILIGKNGAGKSSIITALWLALSHEEEDAFERARILQSSQLALSGTALPGGFEVDVPVLAAYVGLGLGANIAEPLEAVLAQVLQDATVVGIPRKWYLGVSTECAAAHRRSIPPIADIVATKSRFAIEVFRTVARTYESPEPVPYVPLRGAGLGVSLLRSDVETLGRRLFQHLGEPPSPFSQISSSTPWEHDLTVTGLDDEASEGDDPDSLVSDDEAAEVTIRWETETGQVVAAAHAELLVIDGIPNAGYPLRVSLTDPVSLAEGFVEIETLLARRDDPVLGRAASTVQIFLRNYGPAVSAGPWFSADAYEAAVPLGRLLAVEALANELAPRFIASEGRIIILPPQDAATEVVAVGLLDDACDYTTIAKLPSGLARWVGLLTEYALEEVNARLSVATLRSDSSRPSATRFELAHQLKDLLLARKSWAGSGSLLLADEPELHLHPSAQEEVVEWCLASSRRTSMIVATHSPPFLRLAAGEGRLVRVVRDPIAGTRTDTLGGSFLEGLDEIASDLGLGRDRLLQLLRGIVVVEGVADQLVLKTLGSDILDRYRLVVIPISGHKGTKAIVEGEFALALGVPMAVIFDNVTQEALNGIRENPDLKVSDEVRNAGRLLSMRQRGLSCTIIPYDDPDIIAALPELSMRRQFPMFQSWADVKERWIGSDVSYKHFVLDFLQVSRRDDLRTIERVLRSWDGREEPPASFRRTLSGLRAWADDLGIRMLRAPL